MPVQSKNLKHDDSPDGNEEEVIVIGDGMDGEEAVEIAEPVAASKPGKPRPPFGWCMFGRHEFCKVTLEDGTKCNCTKCGESHGVKYVPADLDTPLNQVFRKIVEAHKKGQMYSESEEFLASEQKNTLTLKSQEPQVSMPEPSALSMPVAIVADEVESIEDLEKKRA
jgi:hypothetical protein